MAEGVAIPPAKCIDPVQQAGFAGPAPQSLDHPRLHVHGHNTAGRANQAGDLERVGRRND